VLSNRPPAITPIRPQAVLLHAELRFNVEAADPVDRDAVALWAADVPPGATFSAVTNAGAVTNAFVWTHAGPVGSYATTFFAADKDGTNSQTVALRVNPPPPSNQSVVVHFNEIRFNDDGTDDAEFLELVAPAGTNLQDCYLVHYNGDDGSDGGLWTFRFPACTVPDDGVTDVQGGPLGFVVLSQPGAAVPNSDFELPLDPASGASLQNGADGVVLYDPSGNILDAVAWPEFGFSDPGDLPLDDPGTVTTEGRPENPNFLHLIPYSRDDSSLQAPDNVVSNSGSLWLPLPSTPGLINGSQTSGALILTPYAAPPPLPLNGPVLLIR
jgi:hypothetical protein